jgi:site-specific DNA-methyltransferase (adenine-specific)
MGKERIKEKGSSAHPTQKPIKLIEKLIDVHTDIEGTVLDPFLGSGTTAVACEKLGRRWIGIEISEKYCEIAKQRIKSEYEQYKLKI